MGAVLKRARVRVQALRAALDRRRFFIDRGDADGQSESDWSSDDDYK
jgi:hypothetical protein